MLEIREDTLDVGSVVAAAYRLERIVGQGGMGVVWAARELRTGRPVALKFLREGREADARNHERVLREARAAMAIAHPAVARVEAVLETPAGVPFLVMELLSGESLRELLRRSRAPLGVVTCAGIFLPVVDAVLAAHASFVVHRDLKPENVFLGQDQRVRVLDFGIAKQLPHAGEADGASLTSTGALVGTPMYMAPEQIFGDHDIGFAADVWSLGIMLYECLAGRPPTDGDGFGPIIKRITTGELVPLEHARAGLPRRITSLVGRMLTREAARRPPLLEVRAVLAEILDAGEGAAPSAHAPYPPYVPAVAGGTTTGGVAATPRHMISGAPVPAPRGSNVALVVGLVAVIAVIGVTSAALLFMYERRGGAIAARPLPSGMTAFQEATRLSKEAFAAQAKRDGKTCMARLDDYDAELGAADASMLTTNPAGNMATIRATCMMLAGKCQDGKRLYIGALASLAGKNGSDPNMDPNVLTEYIVADFCEGSDVTPREELLRANHRLAGLTPLPVPVTAAECHHWLEVQTRLLAQHVPTQGAGKLNMNYMNMPDPLGTCLAKANAPRAK